MVVSTILLLLFAGLTNFAAALTPETFEINLDLPPIERYTELGRIKSTDIKKFIDHLEQK